MKFLYTLLITMFVSINVNAEIISSMKAFVVKKDQQGEEFLAEATKVAPKDIIQYEMVFTNTSDDTLSDVEFTGNIKNDLVVYVKKATTQGDDTKVMYSINNGTDWSEKPTKTIIENGIEKIVEANVSEYNKIKWILDSLKAKETKKFVYRVKVN